MEELGDLRGAQVPALGCLRQRDLPFLRLSPVWGTTLRLSGSDGIERSTQAGRPAIIPGAVWLPAGVLVDLDQADVAGPDLNLRKAPAAVAPARQLACTAIVLPLGMPDARCGR